MTANPPHRPRRETPPARPLDDVAAALRRAGWVCTGEDLAALQEHLRRLGGERE